MKNAGVEIFRFLGRIGHQRIKILFAGRNLCHIKSIHISQWSSGELASRNVAHGRCDSSRDEVRASLLAAIKACTVSRDLDKGKVCHADATKTGEASNFFVASSLLNMYAKCGSMEDARKVFDSIPRHNVVTWNTLILGYVEIGEEQVALDAFHRMQAQGCVPDARSIVSAIKACTGLAAKESPKQIGEKLVKIEALQKGLAIHAQVRRSTGLQDVFVASTLVSMYARCGSLENARMAFEKMPCHNVVSWNAIILGTVDNGEAEAAVELFARMRQTGAPPNFLTFVAALKGCANLSGDETQVSGRPCKLRVLETCMDLHSEAAKFCCDSNIFVASSLVQLYAKLGSMVDAGRVFERMACCDAATFNALVLGYVENGKEQLALDLFARMEAIESGTNAQSFVAALKACAIQAAMEKGRKLDGKLVNNETLRKCVDIHSRAAERGYESHMFVASSLVDLYAKCGDVAAARKVFEKMVCKDVVLWTSIMLGHAENGEGEQAMELFQRMKSEGCAPDALTFVAALKACIALASREESKEVDGRLVRTESLQLGTEIYLQAVKSNFHTDMLVSNTAMDFYAKCGSMLDARRVFDGMASRSVVSWTVMILGYAENGEGELALEFFERMKTQGCSPNSRTFVAAFKACCCLAEKEEAKQINGKLVKVKTLQRGTGIYSQAVESCGDSTNIFLVNTVLDMFVKCGSMADARQHFEKMENRDVISWTVLLLGYADTDEFEVVLELFAGMRDEGITPDPLTYVAAFKACAGLASKEEPKQMDGMLAKLGSLDKGMAVHSQAASGGDDTKIFVGNTLVDMYAKCWSVLDARRVFDKMESHTTVSWNALIQGYADGDQGELALEIFFWMQANGFEQDPRTLAAALKACGSVVAMDTGKAIHARLSRHGLEDDPVLETCLVDFYGKCGCMVHSRHVFDKQTRRDSVAFAALISGYSRQGDMEDAAGMFRQLRHEELKPEAVTFVSLLTGFSHAGLADRAKSYFHAMEPRNNELESAVAMVESSKLLEESPSNSSVAWTAILSACHKWKNVKIARLAFQNLQRLDAAYGPAYVLMANIYGGTDD
ncbi:pentatricopeptide repeat-containing protein At2g33680-like isoform X2 [Selaginella moellendorffii]|uniref:pentatricopeptide repeat-containing protein At2g33680-like isoform X2 n=1 Tax=Selaginella moellendorffii TaxID=88036 RepID=UPI000D1CF0C4|nr:pentatricopeptide repeat-containing protein At2g33680-like isoform X2 [Selaginella moellendorffii]|eukprot:XP_024543640.1 pentatricopeptide repeat-containing protein At2g33680-like isoform X2 [Selaginella moellendorffii]